MASLVDHSFSSLLYGSPHRAQAIAGDLQLASMLEDMRAKEEQSAMQKKRVIEHLLRRVASLASEVKTLKDERRSVVSPGSTHCSDIRKFSDEMSSEAEAVRALR